MSKRKPLIEDLSLTEDEINTVESCRHLSSSEKKELSSFIYTLSLILYNSYFEGDAKH